MEAAAAASELLFEQAFERASLRGDVDALDRDYWLHAYQLAPDETRAALLQPWEETA